MKRIFFLISMSLLSVTLWANGGPVDGCSIVRTGDMRLQNKPDVQLIKEDLHINVEGDYCTVNVIYTLHNNSAKAQAINYGFPVDFSLNEAKDDDATEITWDKRYISKMQFLLNSKALQWEEQIEPKTAIYLNPKAKDDEAEEDSIEYKRKWYSTKFNIEKDETATLEVSYRILSSFTDWEGSYSFLTRFGNKELLWDFSPAQYWGNGKANEINVKIDVVKNSIDANSLTIDAKGMKFVKAGESYTFNAKDFAFAGRRMDINYSNSDLKTEEKLKSNILKNVKFFNIKASSAKAGYPAANAFDGDMKTAWVPEGNGVGSWIEFSTDARYVLSAIVVGGYQKSQEAYFNNSRPSMVKIQYFPYKIKGEDYFVPEFEMQIPDSLIFSDKLHYAKQIFDGFESGDQYWTPQRVRISIEEIFKGKKFQDTCISEIYLIGYEKDSIKK
jgi:hypothetical protein